VFLHGCGEKKELQVQITDDSSKEKVNISEQQAAIEGIEQQIDTVPAEEQAVNLCGDGTCSADENTCICEEDCGVCAEKGKNGSCYTFQCNQDNECVSERVEGSCCGDGVCQDTETCDSCFYDCCEQNKDLKLYPGLVNGMTPVIGDQASSLDVIVMGNVVVALKKNKVLLEKAVLSSEVSDIKDTRYFVYGSACDNEYTAELFQPEIEANNGDCRVFSEGVGVIRLYQTSPNRIAVVATGNTAEDAKKAGEVLANYEKFPLNGKYIEVRGGDVDNYALTVLEE